MPRVRGGPFRPCPGFALAAILDPVHAVAPTFFFVTSASSAFSARAKIAPGSPFELSVLKRIRKP